MCNNIKDDDYINRMIISMRKNNIGMGTISKELNVTRDKVRYICSKYGYSGILAKQTTKIEKEKPKKYCKCGKELPKYKQLYCSIDCKNKFGYYSNIVKHKLILNVCDNGYKIKIKRKSQLEKYKVKSCKICNKKFLTTNKNKRLCSKECTIKSRNRNSEKTKQKLYKLFGNEYKLLSDYINTKIKVLIRHNKCGHEYEVTPNHFLQGDRCPKCKIENRRKFTAKQFEKKIYSITYGEYSVFGNYINIKTNVLIRHNKCNRIWDVAPKNFFKGTRCPYCSGSNSEKIIVDNLDYRKINYKIQYKFKDCKDDKELPFDFAVFNDKNELTVLIECDGQQHFKPVDLFGGEKGFVVRKSHDQIKNKYCITNNIPLIRIPYWEFSNIEYILENVLMHFKLINDENNTYNKEIVNKYLVDSEWNHNTYLSWNDKDKRNVPMKHELLHN